MYVSLQNYEAVQAWSKLVNEHARAARLSSRALANKISISLNHQVTHDEVASWLEGHSLPEQHVHEHLLSALGLLYNRHFLNDSDQNYKALAEFREDIENAYLALIQENSKHRGNRPEKRKRREITPLFEFSDGRQQPLHCYPPDFVGPKLLYEQLAPHRLKEIQKHTADAVEFFICYRLLHHKRRGDLTHEARIAAQNIEKKQILPDPNTLTLLCEKYFRRDFDAASKFKDLVVSNRLAIIRQRWADGDYFSIGRNMRDLPREVLPQELQKFYEESPDKIIFTRGHYIHLLRLAMGYSREHAASILDTDYQIIGKLEGYNLAEPEYKNGGIIDGHIAKLEAAYASWEEAQGVPRDQRLSRYFGEHLWKNLPTYAGSMKSHAKKLLATQAEVGQFTENQRS